MSLRAILKQVKASVPGTLKPRDYVKLVEQYFKAEQIKKLIDMKIKLHVPSVIYVGATGAVFFGESCELGPLVVKSFMRETECEEEFRHVCMVRNQCSADTTPAIYMRTAKMIVYERTGPNSMDLFDAFVTGGCKIESRKNVAKLGRRLHKLVKDVRDSTGWVHGDLKPENVVCEYHPDMPIDKRIDVMCETMRLIDFAFMIKANQTYCEQWLGTPAYSPPECMTKTVVPDKYLSWAWGVMMYHFTTREELYSDYTLEKIAKIKYRENMDVDSILNGPLSKVQDESLRELLKQCFRLDDTKRICFDDIANSSVLINT